MPFGVSIPRSGILMRRVSQELWDIESKMFRAPDKA
jgi:hypothetical protein